MKKTGRRIAKAVVFALLVALIMALLSPVFTPKHLTGGVPESMQGDLDYLVWGDSEGWTAISPMQLWRDQGFSGYNCSAVGQRLQDDLYDLQDILTTRHPKVILMETNMLYGSHGVVGEAEKLVQSLTGRALPFYRYHDQWKEMLTGSKTATERDINRGYHYVTTVQPYVRGEYTQQTDAVATIPQVQQVFLDQIVDLCKEQGIELILFSAPSPDCWTYARHNGISAYAQAHDVTYIDCNLMLDELGIDWNTDALDGGDHLNLSGATKLTAWMGNYLAEKNLLLDHRNDAGYDTWNEDLQAYEAQG
jgi:hypothetical protein